MANGIYIGMSGAIAAQRRLDVVANNVANANTPGFRQQRAQFETFLVQTNDQRPIEKGFVAATATHTDDSAGAIMQTGNPLDVAIDGKGWFAVRGADGQPLLTRAGNFHLGSDGTLLDTMGNAVLSGPGLNGGPIQLRSDGGQPSVGSDGSVSQDGTVVATLSVVDVETSKLQPVGNTHFRLVSAATGVADIRPLENATVAGGALESSNVNPVRGLVELVQLTQDFQSSQKVMAEYRRLDQKLLSSK
ncbi:MAG TPA: flagellar hook basal-body protein [Nannocystaceae bacterium]|nr:flagellar hook basal-body protein [Nannocystaceae bacterium]